MSTSSHTDELDLFTHLAADHDLHGLVEELRSIYTFGPPPEPGVRLAAVLARGLRPGTGLDEQTAIAPVPLVVTRPRRRGTARLQGRRARLGLAAAVAGLSVLGTGAAGALPGPVQSAFERAVEAVGLDLPDAPPTAPAIPASPRATPMTSPSRGTDAVADSPPSAEVPLEAVSPPMPPGSGADVVKPAPGAGDRPAEAASRGATGDRPSREAQPDLPDRDQAWPVPGRPDSPGSGPPPDVPGRNHGGVDHDGVDHDGVDGPEQAEGSASPGRAAAASGSNATERPVNPGQGQSPAQGLAGAHVVR